MPAGNEVKPAPTQRLPRKKGSYWGAFALIGKGKRPEDFSSGPVLAVKARMPEARGVLPEVLGQLTLTVTPGFPSGPTMCTAQARQGSKLWMVRRISSGWPSTAS